MRADPSKPRPAPAPSRTPVGVCSCSPGCTRLQAPGVTCSATALPRAEMVPTEPVTLQPEGLGVTKEPAPSHRLLAPTGAGEARVSDGHSWRHRRTPPVPGPPLPGLPGPGGGAGHVDERRLGTRRARGTAARGRGAGRLLQDETPDGTAPTHLQEARTETAGGRPCGVRAGQPGRGCSSPGATCTPAVYDPDTWRDACGTGPAPGHRAGAAAPLTSGRAPGRRPP